MKRYNRYRLLPLITAGIAALTLSGCKEESLQAPDFERELKLTEGHKSPLDEWIQKEYTTPYNIEVIWRWDTKLAAYDKNYIPPKVENVKPYLMILKNTFIDTYEEVMGKEFIKPLVPKQFHLLGEWGYNTDGTIVLAQAESGNKFTFFGVNHWDETQGGDYPWVREAVHTMFHEFGHILHQNKKFSEDFEKVTKEYYTSNWYNEEDIDSRLKGFASPYSMLNQNEDFVELIAFYTTMTPEQWNAHIRVGVEAAKKNKKIDPEMAEKGYQAIQTKITMVKDYLKSSWNIDLDEIRDKAVANAKESLSNPEIIPQATPSPAPSATMLRAMSPYDHNHVYCSNGGHHDTLPGTHDHIRKN